MLVINSVGVRMEKAARSLDSQHLCVRDAVYLRRRRRWLILIELNLIPMLILVFVVLIFVL